MSKEVLKKLEPYIINNFSEASHKDAVLMSGFVALYCTAPQDVKIFLEALIVEGLEEAKRINNKSLEKTSKKIEDFKHNKKNILN